MVIWGKKQEITPPKDFSRLSEEEKKERREELLEDMIDDFADASSEEFEAKNPFREKTKNEKIFNAVKTFAIRAVAVSLFAGGAVALGGVPVVAAAGTAGASLISSSVGRMFVDIARRFSGTEKKEDEYRQALHDSYQARHEQLALCAQRVRQAERGEFAEGETAISPEEARSQFVDYIVEIGDQESEENVRNLQTLEKLKKSRNNGKWWKFGTSLAFGIVSGGAVAEMFREQIAHSISENGMDMAGSGLGEMSKYSQELLSNTHHAHSINGEVVFDYNPGELEAIKQVIASHPEEFANSFASTQHAAELANYGMHEAGSQLTQAFNSEVAANVSENMAYLWGEVAVAAAADAVDIGIQNTTETGDVDLHRAEKADIGIINSGAEDIKDVLYDRHNQKNFELATADREDYPRINDIICPVADHLGNGVEISTTTQFRLIGVDAAGNFVCEPINLPNEARQHPAVMAYTKQDFLQYFMPPVIVARPEMQAGAAAVVAEEEGDGPEGGEVDAKLAPAPKAQPETLKDLEAGQQVDVVIKRKANMKTGTKAAFIADINGIPRRLIFAEEDNNYDLADNSNVKVEIIQTHYDSNNSNHQNSFEVRVVKGASSHEEPEIELWDKEEMQQQISEAFASGKKWRLDKGKSGGKNFADGPKDKICEIEKIDKKNGLIRIGWLAKAGAEATHLSVSIKDFGEKFVPDFIFDEENEAKAEDYRDELKKYFDGVLKEQTSDGGKAAEVSDGKAQVETSTVTEKKSEIIDENKIFEESIKKDASWTSPDQKMFTASLLSADGSEKENTSFIPPHFVELRETLAVPNPEDGKYYIEFDIKRNDKVLYQYSATIPEFIKSMMPTAIAEITNKTERERIWKNFQQRLIEKFVDGEKNEEVIKKDSGGEPGSDDVIKKDSAEEPGSDDDIEASIIQEKPAKDVDAGTAKDEEGRDSDGPVAAPVDEKEPDQENRVIAPEHGEGTAGPNDDKQEKKSPEVIAEASENSGSEISSSDMNLSEQAREFVGRGGGIVIKENIQDLEEYTDLYVGKEESAGYYDSEIIIVGQDGEQRRLLGIDDTNDVGEAILQSLDRRSNIKVNISEIIGCQWQYHKYERPKLIMESGDKITEVNVGDRWHFTPGEGLPEYDISVDRIELLYDGAESKLHLYFSGRNGGEGSEVENTDTIVALDDALNWFGSGKKI